jgi:hypothetical protein
MKIAVLRLYGAPLDQHWPTRPPADLRDVQFQYDDATGADHVVVLNGVDSDTLVYCQPSRIWAMVQEPPVAETARLYEGQPAFHRLYVPEVPAPGTNRVQFWGALNWHVGKSYDELGALNYPKKTTNLCWVTSNLGYLEGHRKRMRFLRDMQQKGIAVDLWGRGFREIAVKWDVLAPSRYSVSFENYGGGVYWSEKLTDSFLAYSTPFYFGARDIDRYFPSRSYVSIDPDDPHVFEKMQDTIASGFHEDNLSALEEARDLCLNKYNTLFFIAREVMAMPPSTEPRSAVRILRLPRPRRTVARQIDLAVRDVLRPLVPAALLDRYRQWRDSRQASK